MIETVSTHVLDTVAGGPAGGIPVLLESVGPDAAVTTAGSGTTDVDGRVTKLNAEPVAPGEYRLTFLTGDYLAARHGSVFYPRIVIQVVLFDRRHFHLPVLAGTYSYSTYLGS